MDVQKTNISTGVSGVYEDIVPFMCIEGWEFPEGRINKYGYCNHTGEWVKPSDPELVCTSKNPI